MIKSIRDGVTAAPKKAGSTLAGTFRSLARSDSTTAADPLRVPSSGRRCADPVDSCSSEVDDADAAASSLGRSGCASLRRRSVSAGAVSAKQSSPAALQHLGCTSPASFSTTSSSQASHCSSAASAAGRSSFHPASYLPFLGIPASASPAESSATATPRMGGVALVDERSVRAMSNDAEMSRHLRGISAALGCPEDWQARIAALQALQRVCWGYSRDCLAPALQSAGPCSWKAPLVEASLLLQHTKEMCEQVRFETHHLVHYRGVTSVVFPFASDFGPGGGPALCREQGGLQDGRRAGLLPATALPPAGGLLGARLAEANAREDPGHVGLRGQEPAHRHRVFVLLLRRPELRGQAAGAADRGLRQQGGRRAQDGGRGA